MGRYGFELSNGKRAVVSTHGYWFTKDDTTMHLVAELGLHYDGAVDDLTDPELDAEDDGWSFIRDRLEAYFNAEV